MLFLFIRIITRELKPLRRLADEAETIASGQFDATLPDFKRIDEIGQLSHSFGNMQQSLVRYIEELKDTTAQKASIESDLRIASNIQMGMLPEKFPTKDDRDDVVLYASLTPATCRVRVCQLRSSWLSPVLPSAPCLLTSPCPTAS